MSPKFIFEFWTVLRSGDIVCLSVVLSGSVHLTPPTIEGQQVLRNQGDTGGHRYVEAVSSRARAETIGEDCKGESCTKVQKGTKEIRHARITPTKAERSGDEFERGLRKRT